MSRSFAASSSQYIVSGSTGYSIGTGNCTFGAWVNHASAQSGGPVGAMGFGANDPSWGPNNGAAPFSCFWGGSNNFDSTPTVGVWTHLCVRRTGTGAGGLQGFFDGVQEATTHTVGNSFNSGGWTIGAANTTGGFPLDGEVAEAFVYDTDLTDEEVAALASGFAPSMVRPDSLLGYVPCIRDEDRSLTDGLTFTPTNSPTVADHHRIIYPPPKRTVWTAAVVPPATTLKDVVSRGVIARAR